MTTTILVHNNHRPVKVVTEDRVYDHENKVMTDEWKEVSSIDVGVGNLYQTYCTDSRRVTIVEPEIEAKAH